MVVGLRVDEPHIAAVDVLKKNKFKLRKDLTGQTIGNFTVLRFDEEKRQWQCKCNLCGNDQVFMSHKTNILHRHSCGCDNRRPPRDLTGKTFNYLTVLNYAGNSKWRCQCTRCGKITNVDTGKLVSGDTKSCGCLNLYKNGSGQEHEIMQVCINAAPHVNVQQHAHIFKSMNKGRREVDLYIPDLALAIEFNGSVYHAVNGVHNAKPAHTEKFLDCQMLGIHLVTIFEPDWLNERDVVTRYLQSFFVQGKSCDNLCYKTVDLQAGKDFLDFYCPSKLALHGSNAFGQFSDNQLKCVVCFDIVDDVVYVKGFACVDLWENRVQATFTQLCKMYTNVVVAVDNDWFTNKWFDNIALKSVGYANVCYDWFSKRVISSDDAKQKLAKGKHVFHVQRVGVTVYTCGTVDVAHIQQFVSKITTYPVDDVPQHERGPLGFADLTGQTFGALTVLGYERDTNNNIVWCCKCTCGRILRKRHGEVVNNKKDCVHHKTGAQSNHFHDLTGQKFGKLTVIEYAGRSRWICKCDCGKTVNVIACKLTTGLKHSCGCDKVYKARYFTKDYTGQQVGGFTILGYDYDARMWRCKCVYCGNEKLYKSVTVARHNKSCGCLTNKAKFIDFTGKHLNELLVIDRLDVRRWRCKCTICGKEVAKSNHALRTGEAHCPCYWTKNARHVALDE